MLRRRKDTPPPAGPPVVSGEDAVPVPTAEQSEVVTLVKQVAAIRGSEGAAAALAFVDQCLATGDVGRLATERVQLLGAGLVMELEAEARYADADRWTTWPDLPERRGPELVLRARLLFVLRRFPEAIEAAGFALAATPPIEPREAERARLYRDGSVVAGATEALVAGRATGPLLEVEDLLRRGDADPRLIPAAQNVAAYAIAVFGPADRLDDADRWSAEALAAAPDDQGVQETRAVVLTALGRSAEAIVLFDACAPVMAEVGQAVGQQAAFHHLFQARARLDVGDLPGARGHLWAAKGFGAETSELDGILDAGGPERWDPAAPAGPLPETVAERAVLVERIRALVAERGAPVIVAIDGRSGSGKSTLARAVADELGAAVVQGDDFYAGGTASEWDALDAEAKAAHCIDWRRQRVVLDALRLGQTALYRPYDWDAFDGRLVEQPVAVAPAEVVILDGAYSARPELADLIDLRVLLDTPRDLQRARLLAREGDTYRADWEGRWSAAEDHYFGTVVPRSSFDLVLDPAP